jgi:hypothetical protein
MLRGLLESTGILENLMYLVRLAQRTVILYIRFETWVTRNDLTILIMTYISPA